MTKRETALRQLKLLGKKGRDMRLAAEGWNNDFQVLVAIMLSARTLDETVITVCEILFKEYPTAEDISKVSILELEKRIGAVNFFQNKAKYLSSMAKKITDEFGGIIPDTVEELITLAGVGRKTANVYLGSKGGANIGVDTHVTYVSNYLGWVDTTNPVKIEMELEKLFPKSEWNKIGHIMIRFGKTYISKTRRNIWLDWILENSK